MLPIKLPLNQSKEKILFTLKFFSSKKFRHERGIPRFQQLFKSNWELIKGEFLKSEEMLIIWWKLANGIKVSHIEKRYARDQLFELSKYIPALAIFLLPGGLLLLPLVARVLPWDLLPSTFKRKI
jgi:hypothetical protein